MSDRFSLTGKSVLVTGAAGGIGGATARLCAQAGARLVLSDRYEAGCAALGLPDAEILPADLSDPTQVRALAQTAGTCRRSR